MNVRELLTVWGFKVDDKALDKFGHKVNELKHSVLELGKVALEGMAVLAELARETAHNAMEAKLTGERLGITAQKVQELSYAAKMSHVETSAMVSSLRLLQKSALKAAGGAKDAAEMYRKLGIEVRGSDGHLKGSDKLLSEIADKFKYNIPATERSAMAMKLFGRAGATMVPLLLKGSEGIKEFSTEAHKLGVVIDEQGVEKSEALTESFNRMTSMILGLRNIIGLAVMPVLTEMIEKISAWYMANREVIQQNLVGFFTELGHEMEKVWHTLTNGLAIVWKMVEAMGGLDRVLKFVMAGFVAWTALSMIADIIAIINVIKSLTTAIIALDIAEAFATGGANLALGAAAIAAVGLTAYGMGAFDSTTGTPAQNYKPTGAGGGVPGAMMPSQAITIAPVVHVDARHAAPGVGPEVKQHVSEALDLWMAETAATVKSPVAR